MDEITGAAQMSTSAANTVNGCSQSVCIDTLRVYDSCGDKDCLNDLRVYFTNCTQELIDSAVSVRIRDAEVISVLTDIEAVPFHKGFYSLDMTYFFDICLDVYCAPHSSPEKVNGLSVFNKKVILYGSEGSVKVFTSDYSPEEMDIQNGPSKNLPKASVQVAKPVALSAKLCDCNAFVNPPCKIPDKICRCYGGAFEPAASRCVFVTLGVFSIARIERNVQLLIPSYDFCVPEKECSNSSDNPCEVFSKLDFPNDEFFPPNVMEASGENGGCGGCGGCGCNHKCG